MAKQVLDKKRVKNAILWSGLELFQQNYWHKKKKHRELVTYTKQLQHQMQLYFDTKNVVVGIPTFRQEVMLFELDKANPQQHFYEIEKMIDCREGKFIKVEKAITS